MKATPQPNPTPSELEILQVLWSRGPSTVREVHDAVSATKQLGYTTVLKLMQIMTAKGLVTRSETQRAHVYEAQEPAAKTKQQFASDMLQRVFQGSTSELMLHALAGHRSSKEELKELRQMLDEFERKQK
jgi:BlaI family penicillinase repressor